MTAKPFDLLAAFGRFGGERQISLRDPATSAAFLAHVGSAVEQALADPNLLRGQRTEAMFESLLVSLGDVALVKAEDGGRFFAAQDFRAPDFRVVLRDGAHWLIEVKHVYAPDPWRQRRRIFSAGYFRALAAYARATGAELKVAIYWARWSIWTLVAPDRLIGAKGALDLDLATAVQANEMARLGDRMIGTRAPLRLHLSTNPERTSPIDADGTVSVTFDAAQLFCGDTAVTDPVEQEIASIFMQHGEWVADGPFADVDGDRLRAVEFTWAPEEVTDQGFEMVGTLSRMFARYYAEHTIANDAIIQLQAPLRPHWFAPLVQPGHHSTALPLWKFSQQPSYGALDRSATR